VILIDENLSWRLAAPLSHHFPGTVSLVHVSELGAATKDRDVFGYARRAGFVAVLTKDDDFAEMVRRFGPPPRVIHVTLPNSDLKTAREFLLAHVAQIRAFLDRGNTGLLVL
jgi:predicted nuclease of predicted toxin-antitoxin system